jgi:hypothetical protein
MSEDEKEVVSTNEEDENAAAETVAADAEEILNADAGDVVVGIADYEI